MKKNILSILILLVVVVGAVYITKYKRISFFPQKTVQHVVTNTQNSPTLGTYLANTESLALYINIKNPNSDSTCDYRCMKYFKPYVADIAYAGDVDFLSKKYNLGDKVAIVKRSDGLYQYAYDGKLLYTFMGDTKPGDTNGTRMPKDEWKIVNL